MLLISLISFAAIVAAWIVAPEGNAPARTVETVAPPLAAPARA